MNLTHADFSKICLSCHKSWQLKPDGGRVTGDGILVTVKKIAQAAGVSRATIYRWMWREPPLRIVYMGGRARIAEEDLAAFARTKRKK